MELDPLIADWPAAHAAVGVFGSSRTNRHGGDRTMVFALASVTKLLSAWAVLIAAEEEIISLDQPVTIAGATVADLLAHAGGLGPEGEQLAAPRTRRIYSNRGYEILGEAVTRASQMPFGRYVHEAVFEPLHMTDSSIDSPAHGGRSTVADLVAFGTEVMAPTLLSAETVRCATVPHLAELDGVLPGFGPQSPNPWGLGPEIRGSKRPHWTGSANSPETFGHFGQSGTFVWIDPQVEMGCVALTDEAFGPWAATAWPILSDHVLAAAP